MIKRENTMNRMKFHAKGACFIFIVSLIVIGFVKYQLPDDTESKNFPKSSDDVFVQSRLEIKQTQKKQKSDENSKEKVEFDDEVAPETSVVEKQRKTLQQIRTPLKEKIVDLSLPERIVHFDLKGAAPKVSYLLELIPFLKRLGATGLLMEYEDMFPYFGNFSIVRNGDAYKRDDIKTILKSARANNLSVIPLVQTFGHMEWVLKHKQFDHIREIGRYPQVSCPSNNETLKIVEHLIDQIVALHPNLQAIHIGADEAYNVGKECKKCKDNILKLGSKQKLMLKYVAQVAKYVKNKHKLRVLTWNDMFQDADPAELRESGMAELVEPVIWGYSPNLKFSDYFPSGLFERFGPVFPSLWVASAFKGANGPAQTFIDVEKYATNHISWLDLLNSVKKDAGQYRGVILTGWSRFDHFAVLCELFPVGVPSLAVDLQLMQNGGQSKKAYEDAKKLLNCDLSNVQPTLPESELFEKSFVQMSNEQLPPTPPLGTLECTYPGSNVTKLIERLRIVRYATNTFLTSSETQGWLTDYNLKEQYGSVFMAEKGYNRSVEISGYYKSLGRDLRRELTKLFYDDTIDEWLYENIQIYLNKLEIVARSTLTLMHSTTFRNRPLSRLELEL